MTSKSLQQIGNLSWLHGLPELRASLGIPFIARKMTPVRASSRRVTILIESDRSLLYSLEKLKQSDAKVENLEIVFRKGRSIQRTNLDTVYRLSGVRVESVGSHTPAGSTKGTHYVSEVIFAFDKVTIKAGVNLN